MEQDPQLAQPGAELLTLCLQRDHLVHPAAVPEVVPHLVVSRAEASSRIEVAEAAHRSVPPLDIAMVLFYLVFTYWLHRCVTPGVNVNTKPGQLIECVPLVPWML